MDAQTIIMPNLLTLVRDYGKKLASNFLEGESAIGGTMDDELTEFLARRDVSWDSLTTEEQDALRDEALESFKAECARRIVGKSEGPSSTHAEGRDLVGTDVLPTVVLKESIEEFLDVMDRHHGRWFPASEDAVHEAILKLRNSIADHE